MSHRAHDLQLAGPLVEQAKARSHIGQPHPFPTRDIPIAIVLDLQDQVADFLPGAQLEGSTLGPVIEPMLQGVLDEGLEDETG